MAKAILLIRVSTEQQDYEAQTNELIEYAMHDGYSKDELITIKNKESGSKLPEEERQGINKMKEIIEEDPLITCVYVWEISRIGRNEKVIHSVKEYLLNKHINIKCKREGVQLLNEDGTINSQGELVFSLFATLAKQEMEYKIERLMRHKRNCTANGQTPTGRVLFGYIINKEGYVEPDTYNTANHVKSIFNWALEGKSALWIAKECLSRGYFHSKNLRSAQSKVLSILSQPAYCGRKGYRTSTKYQAIVDEVTFDNVQKAKKERTCQLKTITKCNAYGNGLVKLKTNEGKEYAMCLGHCRNSYRANVEGKIISINMNVIDHILWQESIHLYTQYLSQKGHDAYKQLIDEREVILEKKETSLQGKDRIERIKEKKGWRFDNGYMKRDQYMKEMRELESQEKDLENQIARYDMGITRIDNQLKGIGKDNWNIISFKDIEAITDDAKRIDIIKDVIDKVVLVQIGTMQSSPLYRIEIYQQVNFMYQRFYTYYSRGGVFHLKLHIMNMHGNERVKDVQIERRFDSDWSLRKRKHTQTIVEEDYAEEGID